MLKIAVCDNEIHELSRITGLLKEYQVKRSAAYRLDAFTSISELFETMGRETYDILLLNVLMPGFHGKQTALDNQCFGEDTKVIYLTASPKLAVSSYSVNVYYYLLKPVTKAKLFPILDQIYLEEQKASNVLSLKTTSGMTYISYDKLEFLEGTNKKLHFHLTDHSIIEVSGSFSEYEALLLNREEFLKVHRSFIMNMTQIKELLPGKIITVSNHEIPISKQRYVQVRECYMQYLFIEKGVL